MTYPDLAAVKDRLRVSNTASDSILETLLASSIDFVEGYCDRRFGLPVQTELLFTSEVVRTENPSPFLLLRREFIAIRAVKFLGLDGEELTITGAFVSISSSGEAPYLKAYFPLNASLDVAEGLRLGAPVLEIDGFWGYGSTPAAISEAVLALTASFYRKSLTRATGEQLQQRNAAVGEAPGVPFDVLLLMNPYRRFA